MVANEYTNQKSSPIRRCPLQLGTNVPLLWATICKGNNDGPLVDTYERGNASAGTEPSHAQPQEEHGNQAEGMEDPIELPTVSGPGFIPSRFQRQMEYAEMQRQLE